MIYFKAVFKLQLNVCTSTLVTELYSCGHISGPHEPIPIKFGL